MSLEKTVNEEGKIKDMNRESDNIHIQETTERGSEVNIDIDKKNKSVDINIDAQNESNEKERVNVTFSGVNIKREDGKEVNVKFLPWIIFGVSIVFIIIGLVLFTIYNIFKLFA